MCLYASLQVTWKVIEMRCPTARARWRRCRRTEQSPLPPAKRPSINRRKEASRHRPRLIDTQGLRQREVLYLPLLFLIRSTRGQHSPYISKGKSRTDLNHVRNGLSLISRCKRSRIRTRKGNLCSLLASLMVGVSSSSPSSAPSCLFPIKE